MILSFAVLAALLCGYVGFRIGRTWDDPWWDEPLTRKTWKQRPLFRRHHDR